MRTKKIFILFSIFLLCAAVSLAEKPVCSPEYDREVSFVREIFNFHVVTPGIMRGGQPSEKALGLLKKYGGVKTVLSLRDNKQTNDREKRLLDKLGITFINIPMDARKEQSNEKIEQCLKIINDKFNQPIFVHCAAGKDRTGLIFAAYRIKYNDWAFCDAFKEMLFYGYNRVSYCNLERSLVRWNAMVTEKSAGGVYGREK